jgi:uncharacterized integral membrane protein
MNIFKSILRVITVTIKLLLLILVIIFMAQNSESVDITLYPLPFQMQAPAFVLMTLFFVFGLIFGVIICSKTIVKKSFESFSNRRQIKKLQQQIQQD